MTGKKEYNYCVSFSEFIVSMFFTSCITVLALWVITIHTAQILGVSFLNLCILFSVIIVPLLILLAKKYFSEFKNSPAIIRDNEQHTIIILLLLAFIGSAISLGAIRPNHDDVDYISRAIYFLENYNEPVDLLTRHDYGLIQFTLYSVLGIFGTINLFCAYLALILQQPFLHIYHLFLPALGGAMIPLAWFLAFSKFSEKTISAALAATAVCVFLSIDGGSHHSFGNFSFVRIWQGKAILMSIVVPLFTAFTLDYFRMPTFSRWSRLFLLLVTCTGLTSMAAFFMPFLGGLLGFSYCCAHGERWKGSLKKLFWYLSSYMYLLSASLYCYINMNETRMSYIGSWWWFPKTFYGQFKLVFIDSLSYPVIALVLFTILSIVAIERSYRTFLISWILLCVTLFLNPIVFPFVTKITTFNAYWRLFYLLPFPLVVGLPLIIFDRTNKLRPSVAYTVFLTLLTIGIVGNLWPDNKYFQPLESYLLPLVNTRLIRRSKQM